MPATETYNSSGHPANWKLSCYELIELALAIRSCSKAFIKEMQRSHSELSTLTLAYESDDEIMENRPQRFNGAIERAAARTHAVNELIIDLNNVEKRMDRADAKLHGLRD
jgi:hypothetical protein